MALKTPTYGIREFSLRGAPLSREEWLKRNDGHDVRIIEIPDVSIHLEDEMVEVDEEVPAYDTKGVQTGTRKTGKKVLKSTGRKLEVRGKAETNMTLFVDLTTGVLGLDHEDTAPSVEASEGRPAWLPEEFASPEEMAAAFADLKNKKKGA